MNFQDWPGLEDQTVGLLWQASFRSLFQTFSRYQRPHKKWLYHRAHFLCFYLCLPSFFVSFRVLNRRKILSSSVGNFFTDFLLLTLHRWSASSCSCTYCNSLCHNLQAEMGGGTGTGGAPVIANPRWVSWVLWGFLLSHSPSRIEMEPFEHRKELHSTRYWNCLEYNQLHLHVYACMCVCDLSLPIFLQLSHGFRCIFNWNISAAVVIGWWSSTLFSGGLLFLFHISRVDSTADRGQNKIYGLLYKGMWK